MPMFSPKCLRSGLGLGLCMASIGIARRTSAYYVGTELTSSLVLLLSLVLFSCSFLKLLLLLLFLNSTICGE